MSCQIGFFSPSLKFIFAKTEQDRGYHDNTIKYRDRVGCWVHVHMPRTPLLLLSDFCCFRRNCLFSGVICFHFYFDGLWAKIESTNSGIVQGRREGSVKTGGELFDRLKEQKKPGKRVAKVEHSFSFLPGTKVSRLPAASDRSFFMHTLPIKVIKSMPFIDDDDVNNKNQLCNSFSLLICRRYGSSLPGNKENRARRVCSLSILKIFPRTNITSTTT